MRENGKRERANEIVETDRNESVNKLDETRSLSLFLPLPTVFSSREIQQPGCLS